MISELEPWQWEELEKAAVRLASGSALEENRSAEKKERDLHEANKKEK